MGFFVRFTLIGGIGIPIVFVLAWQIVRGALSGDSLISVMEWFEAFRIMFWPSAALLAFRTPEDGTGQWMDLFLAVLGNIGVYAIVASCLIWARRNWMAQALVVVLLLASMYALNLWWSQHLGSFLVAAVILVLLFVGLWKVRIQRGQPAN